MTTFNDTVFVEGGAPVALNLLEMGGGNKFFFDPSVTTSGNGLTPSTAVKTLKEAYDLCTDGNNDIVYYIAGATSHSLAAKLDWAKSYTHLVGVCAPVGAAKRARIFMTAGVADTPMMTVSGSGCYFANLYFFHGVASAAALGCFLVSGSRNAFDNVHFAGIGNDTQDAAGAYSLSVTGDENLFRGCQIGLDTIARGTAANYEILFDGSAKRNVFEDCLIYAFIEANTHVLIAVADNEGIAGYTLFRNCILLSESNNNATAMASAMTVPVNMVTNYIVFDSRCLLVGITAIEANARTKTYAGMVAPAATAGGGIATVK